MSVPRYRSHTHVSQSVRYGKPNVGLTDRQSMVLHAEVNRDMPYPGTGRKMPKSVHISGRVLGYGLERRQSRSKQRARVAWYISTYNVGGPSYPSLSWHALAGIHSSRMLLYLSINIVISILLTQGGAVVGMVPQDEEA